MSNWLAEFTIGFLQSPTWRVPIDSFIDARCLVFDNEEENKHEYATCHQDYLDMIDHHLETALQDLGVKPEEFLAAFGSGETTDNQQLDDLLFSEILAMTDFLAFKKMMVARNVELELIVLKHMQEEAAKKKAAQKAAADAQAKDVTDDQVWEGMSASVQDYLMKQKELEKEQAELEAAIQLSLAVEAERLKQIENAEKEEETAQKEAVVANSGKKVEAEKRVTVAKKKKERLMFQQETFLESVAGAKPQKLAPLPGGSLSKSLQEMKAANKQRVAEISQVFAENKVTLKKAEVAPVSTAEQTAAAEAKLAMAKRQAFFKEMMQKKQKEEAERRDAERKVKLETSKASIETAVKDANLPPPKVDEPKDDTEQENRQAYRNLLATQFKMVENKRKVDNSKLVTLNDQMNRVAELNKLRM